MSSSLEYKIGELTAKFEETLRRFDKNDEDHLSMQVDIRSLNVWRWRVVGMVIALSGVTQGVLMAIKLLVK